MFGTSNKLNTFLFMFTAVLLTAIVTIAITGSDRSEAQVSSTLQPPSPNIGTVNKPSVTHRVPTQSRIVLPSGLSAVKVGSYINIATGHDGKKIVLPSTDDMATAAMLCPDNSEASAPEYMTGSYRQLKGSDDDIGVGSYDIGVTVKTTITCQSR